jgi:uncharacterized protein YyaL (SSP411 family)
MPNRLAHETSPYLLQHAGNPVDWYPWGEEAIARATAEEKPIFLSIGYSACHWCHVMEHESFENEAIAGLMNSQFINIKVDREERPDLDQIYMNAVQLMTGRGGWPMSVFLTPDLKPFYGGTYWPPTARGGMPGFDQVLLAVSEAWRERRPQALEQAESLTDHLAGLAAGPAEPKDVAPALVQRAVSASLRSFDHQHGGFGGAPKFPHPMDLRLLAQHWCRTRDEESLHVLRFTLDKMAAGGIYDQLGGGFHRYSTDAHWLVPHFEKMLYDNALLVPCYLDAFLITGDADYARVARETCDYVLREMTDAGGGFYSTQDADSEGVEGKFFVWTPAEIESVLGKDAAETFCHVYGVTPRGNFEHGTSILHLPHRLADVATALLTGEDELREKLAAWRAKLLEVRSRRIPPGRDDKVLVAWNGMMLDALAQAAGVLDESRYLAAAQQAANFLLNEMRQPDGSLLHTWRHGRARLAAYLDDYTCLAVGLVSLYEADFDERWLAAAVELMDYVHRHFHDDDRGGYFYTAANHEALITRQKDFYDNAVPSGNSLAALALVKLGKLLGRGDYLDTAQRTMRAAAPLVEQAPQAAGQMLLAIDLMRGPTPEIAIVGDPQEPQTASALHALRQTYLPRKVLACRTAKNLQDAGPLSALFAGKMSGAAQPAVYLCEQFTCQAPVFGPAAAESLWRQLSSE